MRVLPQVRRRDREQLMRNPVAVHAITEPDGEFDRGYRASRDAECVQHEQIVQHRLEAVNEYQEVAVPFCRLKRAGDENRLLRR
jgi:hypothetical protein